VVNKQRLYQTCCNVANLFRTVTDYLSYLLAWNRLGATPYKKHFGIWHAPDIPSYAGGWELEDCSSKKKKSLWDLYLNRKNLGVLVCACHPSHSETLKIGPLSRLTWAKSKKLTRAKKAQATWLASSKTWVQTQVLTKKVSKRNMTLNHKICESWPQ
jgi:hypothetical protein